MVNLGNSRRGGILIFADSADRQRWVGRTRALFSKHNQSLPVFSLILYPFQDRSEVRISGLLDVLRQVRSNFALTCNVLASTGHTGKMAALNS